MYAAKHALADAQCAQQLVLRCDQAGWESRRISLPPWESGVQ